MAVSGPYPIGQVESGIGSRSMFGKVKEKKKKE